MKKAENVDDYIAGFDLPLQTKLSQVRAAVKKAAPKAVEVISYGMPAYKLNSLLVFFAGYERHVGFYPTPSAVNEFKKEVSVYKWAKGSIQFPLDKPMPVGLITKMVKFRVKEDQQKKLAKDLLKNSVKKKKPKP